MASKGEAKSLHQETASDKHQIKHRITSKSPVRSNGRSGHEARRTNAPQTLTIILPNTLSTCSPLRAQAGVRAEARRHGESMKCEMSWQRATAAFVGTQFLQNTKHSLVASSASLIVMAGKGEAKSLRQETGSDKHQNQAQDHEQEPFRSSGRSGREVRRTNAPHTPTITLPSTRSPFESTSRRPCRSTQAWRRYEMRNVLAMCNRRFRRNSVPTKHESTRTLFRRRRL